MNCNRVIPAQRQDGTFSVELKKDDVLVISLQNIDEEMTSLHPVSVLLSTEGESVYDLAGRRYASVSGRCGIHVVNGQKCMLRR